MVVRLSDDEARVDGRASVDELGELFDTSHRARGRGRVRHGRRADLPPDRRHPVAGRPDRGRRPHAHGRVDRRPAGRQGARRPDARRRRSRRRRGRRPLAFGGQPQQGCPSTSHDDTTTLGMGGPDRGRGIPARRHDCRHFASSRVLGRIRARRRSPTEAVRIVVGTIVAQAGHPEAPDRHRSPGRRRHPGGRDAGTGSRSADVHGVRRADRVSRSVRGSSWRPVGTTSTPLRRRISIPIGSSATTARPIRSVSRQREAPRQSLDELAAWLGGSLTPIELEPMPANALVDEWSGLSWLPIAALVGVVLTLLAVGVALARREGPPGGA